MGWMASLWQLGRGRGPDNASYPLPDCFSLHPSLLPIWRSIAETDHAMAIQ